MVFLVLVPVLFGTA